MNGPEILKQNVDILKTRMGACYPGVRAVFRGFDLHKELKDIDWIDLYMFGVTGRRFSPSQLRLLNSIWTYTSYPDARIWNNRVAALAGTARSTGNLGISAALAVSEASIYGRGIDIRAIDFLIRTRNELDKGGNLADCVKKELETFRGIAGYGRPLTSVDERIAPITELARSLGLDEGPHILLAHAVDKFLLDGRWRLRMNYGALCAAFTADMGLTPQEFYRFAFPGFLSGMQPCYIEAEENPEGSLFPLSCSHIIYDGKPKRTWLRPDDVMP
jgi:hypothetical protein